MGRDRRHVNHVPRDRRPGDPANVVYTHDATLTQVGQNVGGSGQRPRAQLEGTWVVNAGSTVVNNTLTLTWNYTNAAFARHAHPVCHVDDGHDRS